MDNQKLIHYLNQLLSNQFVMYVKLHRYHWYIQGSHFFQLHDLFEEMYEQFAKQLDETAERILMINGKPLATMASYIKEASLVEASADDKEKEILMQLQDDLNQLITEIHDLGLRAAHDNRDEVTIDMLIGFQQYYEKMLWMSKAYLHQL
ncbi:starvation-inducible DNA-binding protein [Cerasibacillus quisquiliarum]|uniref:General stress protein 20U n=1 Tax=Cerasibacillus quisquiliarum TaxID=227865 RepID=A0A511UXM2_9BACI|nr:DNA starvation/stationary phase protection protein [Cerasibacillus quisquiliarum]MBB5145937.1 starvation-inducible DNA-binding protein [Cerasibacillus quisquiliarum]GEN30508.1 general stress protein 20U [Cerasibacillus quisquiliarum]